MKPFLILLLLATAALADNECTYTTSVVARSKEQHTGIAWAPHQGGKWSNGRLFVTYPYYSLHDHRISVAEVVPRECRAGEEPGKGATGCVDFLPFPSALINRPLTPAGLDHIYRNMHQGRAAPDLSGALINVQSIWCDRYGSLWILDNANVLAARGGAIPGEAKLIQVDVSGVPMPGKERVVRQIKLAASLTPRDSSLNDLRVDLGRSVAYITDSGLPGIIVLDLNTGKAVRRLATHPSTHAELTESDVAGRPQEVVGHVDGIANDVRRDVVYFQALSSRTLYAVSGSMLRDTSVSEAELGNAVRVVASEADGWTTGDGLAIDEQGRVYQTSLEKSAIRRVDPNASTLTHPEHLRGSGSGGIKVETLAAEEELLGWPDSMGMVATGRFPGTYSGDAFYVTNSGVHFGRGARNPVEGGWPILQVKKECKAAVELQ